MANPDYMPLTRPAGDRDPAEFCVRTHCIRLRWADRFCFDHYIDWLNAINRGQS